MPAHRIIRRMSARIIDGRQIAEQIRSEMKQEVAQLRARGVVPGLGVVLVGDDPASHSYVTAKQTACAEAGLHAVDARLPADTTKEQLLSTVDRLNHDPAIHGILVQLPLPRHLDDSDVLLQIDPTKDVDGFHPVNVGRMVLGQETFLPCTPHGVIQLLVRSGVQIAGAHVVIVGRSNIVGKPLANMLIQKATNANATVTVCHTGTRDLTEYTRRADILIAAVGKPEVITADMVRPGVVVIDVGVNRVPDASRKNGFRLVGDVHFEGVKKKASQITPVPGGVGPMTITMLMYNTIQSARRRLPSS